MMNIGATVVLTIHPLRQNANWLLGACMVLFVAVWIEKGLGLVVPGFVPSPLGEVVEYAPTWVEFCVAAGIWAMGLFVLTVLVRVALPIELGQQRSPFAPRVVPQKVPRRRASKEAASLPRLGQARHWIFPRCWDLRVSWSCPS